MSKFYAVAVGRKIGVFTSWKECQASTHKFPKARFRSFESLDDAEAYVRQNQEIPVNYQQPKVNLNPAVLNCLRIAQNTGLWESEEDYRYETFVPYRISESTPGWRLIGKNYGQYPRSILDPKSSRVIPVYLDGSKIPTIKHRGSGCYLRFACQDYGFSIPYTEEVGKRYGFTYEEGEALSSPSMEYLALTEFLWRMLALRLPEKDGVVQMINPRIKIVIVADYIGVRNFSEGDWKPKESHIIKMHVVVVAIREWLRVRGIDLIFHHIDGHDGVLGNELSDLMAKSPAFLDSITTWVSQLSGFLSAVQNG